jgi:hypothetical protein
VRLRGVMRLVTRLWEPWVAWPIEQALERLPEDGLEVVHFRLVVDDLIKLISIRTMK